MAIKTNNKPSGQYEGVKNAVKANVTPIEPRIHPDHVAAAFRSFGIPINDRNHNDLAYWGTKGQSEMPKLIDELHKRRMDINNREDDNKKTEEQKKKTQEDFLNKHNESKATLPRLSDDDIHKLYDEYGLPSPDKEWVRNNMSNDPNKIRSILDMQRKTSDDMLKKHLKNQVNSIPEVPKGSVTSTAVIPPNNTASAAPGSMGVGGPGYGYGMGGPGDTSGPATPFFIGDHSLVRIVHPNNPNSGTLWLVDSKKKVLRPILSEKAFQNAFEDPEAAKNSITTLSSSSLGHGGPLAGFKPLGEQHGVKEDGSMSNLEFSPAQIQKRYGKPQDPAAEQKSLHMLDSVLGKIGGQLGNSGQQDPQNQALQANS